MTNEMKKMVDEMKKQLHLADTVDILEAVKNNDDEDELYYFRCIDNAEFDDADDAVYDSPNPNAARKIYRAEPHPFYIAAASYGDIGGKWEFSIMSSAEISVIKKSGIQLTRVDL